jgi:hypothetical protein
VQPYVTALEKTHDNYNVVTKIKEQAEVGGCTG